jgi:hypothetical protein
MIISEKELHIFLELMNGPVTKQVFDVRHLFIADDVVKGRQFGKPGDFTKNTSWYAI